MDFELLQWELSLVPSLAESANDARITLWLNEGFPNPYTSEDAERFIGAAQKIPVRSTERSFPRGKFSAE